MCVLVSLSPLSVLVKFINFSLCTTLCLLWEPEVIAIAVMYLAAKLSKFDVKDWKDRQPHQGSIFLNIFALTFVAVNYDLDELFEAPIKTILHYC